MTLLANLTKGYTSKKRELKFLIRWFHTWIKIRLRWRHSCLRWAWFLGFKANKKTLSKMCMRRNNKLRLKDSTILLRTWPKVSQERLLQLPLGQQWCSHSICNQLLPKNLACSHQTKSHNCHTCKSKALVLQTDAQPSKEQNLRPFLLRKVARSLVCASSQKLSVSMNWLQINRAALPCSTPQERWWLVRPTP